jgi:hypothetical protein
MLLVILILAVLNLGGLLLAALGQSFSTVDAMHVAIGGLHAHIDEDGLHTRQYLKTLIEDNPVLNVDAPQTMSSAERQLREIAKSPEEYVASLAATWRKGANA